MADAVHLRRATVADAGAFAKVIDAAYAPFLAAGLHLPPVSAGIADDIAAHHVWLAEGEAGILGGIVLALGPRAQVVNLAVHPRAAGQGLGRRLLGAAAAAARAAGHARLHLATHAGMTATRAFYARQGWVETGQEGDKVYMSRNLDDEGAGHDT